MLYYVGLVLGCIATCASADRCFMSDLYLVALIVVHQLTDILCQFVLGYFETCASATRYFKSGLYLVAFESCASADRYFMSDLYLVALRDVRAVLPSSFRFLLTFRLQFLDTLKCKMNPDLRTLKA
jgi:hypothetical protein